MSNDALLIFPPQWSPFQPALALPSLAAWVRRAGFQVKCTDLNIAFYEWLLSEECAAFILDRLETADLGEAERLGYQAIFASSEAFRSAVRRQLTPRRDLAFRSSDDVALVASQYMSVRAFQTYLGAISRVNDDFKVSPYEFRLSQGNLDSEALDAILEHPPALLAHWLAQAAPALAAQGAPVVGLSCIGQEQLVLTLLLGKWLKANTNAAVLVGGTIFSRIFERGVLPVRWFGRFFDVIVRNEGERPLEAMLANRAAGRELCVGVPGVVYRVGDGLEASPPCAPLKADEIPTPDFDDLPLPQYFSPEITLPLLSARGCYWGKCEFCHHGMVYGERFQAYSTQSVLESVRTLAKRHGVRHFAFNDEAIPPRILREMGHQFPQAVESNWRFTGLVKFERSYTREDFTNLRAVGFRSLYVGLESASERVLDLMRKNNTKETMLRNLRDCKFSDIWLHCFLFFGFPGETAEDAQETYDFVLNNSDIISSFGTATFVLEHNAPIYHHPEDFGIQIRSRRANDIDVYYQFEVEEGCGISDADAWRMRLNEAALGIPKYTAIGWVPRELQLCLLSEMTIDRLLAAGAAVRDQPGAVPPESSMTDVVNVLRLGQGSATCVVNMLTGHVLQLRGNAATLAEYCAGGGYSLGDVSALSIVLWRQLFDDASAPADLGEVSHPLPAPL